MNSKSIIIMTTLASFVLAGPALAVKKVSKSNESSTENKQKADDNQMPSQGNQPANQPANDSPGGRQEKPDRPEKPDRSDRTARPEPPQRPSAGENDNFKDDNGDGLNDNIKKPPEIVKKKRGSNPEGSKDEKRSR